MNVLSLFDGISCGQQALERAGIKVDKYFASEIDKYAIKVTMANYPNTIQLGSVVGVDGYSLPKIDILIGGSPCQSFSFAGKRKGMSTKDEQEILTLDHYLKLKAEQYEFEGQSYLFWEYMRLLNEVKPTYFLLENVLMGEKWEKVLTKAIGVKPIEINSALVSGQNRRRLYWTNIGMKPSGLFGDLESTIQQPKDKGILLKDILESDVDEKYFLSEKMLNYLNTNSELQQNNGNGFKYKPTDGNEKGKAITTKEGSRMDDNFIRIPEATKKGYVEIKPGDCLDAENLNSETRRGRLMEEKSNCLMAKKTDFMYYEPKNRKVLQLSNNNKSNGGTQPYQQDRIYDINGISPALQAQLPNGGHSIIKSGRIRRLTPIECERLQTVNDNYTDCVSDSQRYKMLGNGWTVDVIAHIFSYL